MTVAKPLPGRPLACWAPTDVKKRPLVLFQLGLFWMKALFVFSPTLKIYLPASNSMIMVGSVSEVTVLSILADQLMLAAVCKDRRRILDAQDLLRHERPCSMHSKLRWRQQKTNLKLCTYVVQICPCSIDEHD